MANIGFKIPEEPPSNRENGNNAAYPQAYPQPNYYPQQPYPPQNNAQQPVPIYQHQPFPAPFNQGQPGSYNQPMMQQAGSNWHANTNFTTYLRNASSFHVKQKVELLEAFVGWETPNRYTVKDQNGHKVFYVGEEADCLGQQCCGNSRAFTLTVKDGLGMDLLRFERSIDCSCCCGLLCPDALRVTTATGQLLGTVNETFNLLYPSFKLKNAAGQTVLKLKGPLCPLSFGACNPQVVFRVTTPEEVSVGTISKEWSGFVRELFTDADYFSMSFPHDLDPSMKAVCLGALFLIDFQYFEKGACSDSQGNRRLFG